MGVEELRYLVDLILLVDESLDKVALNLQDLKHLEFLFERGIVLVLELFDVDAPLEL